MDFKLIYTGEMREGGLHIFRRNELLKMLDTHFMGKKLEIIFRIKRKRRSLSQNAYYWGVIIPMIYTGMLDAGWQMDTEEVHDYLKKQFNIKEFINEQTGEIIKSIGSTTKMTTVDMMDYFAEITQWAAEFLNVKIPEPNEQLTISEDNSK